MLPLSEFYSRPLWVRSRSSQHNILSLTRQLSNFHWGLKAVTGGAFRQKRLGISLLDILSVRKEAVI
jgi:hypothetical protein